MLIYRITKRSSNGFTWHQKITIKQYKTIICAYTGNVRRQKSALLEKLSVQNWRHTALCESDIYDAFIFKKAWCMKFK